MSAARTSGSPSASSTPPTSCRTWTRASPPRPGASATFPLRTLMVGLVLAAVCEQPLHLRRVHELLAELETPLRRRLKVDHRAGDGKWMTVSEEALSKLWNKLLRTLDPLRAQPQEASSVRRAAPRSRPTRARPRARARRVGLLRPRAHPAVALGPATGRLGPRRGSLGASRLPCPGRDRLPRLGARPQRPKGLDRPRRGLDQSWRAGHGRLEGSESGAQGPRAGGEVRQAPPVRLRAARRQHDRRGHSGRRPRTQPHPAHGGHPRGWKPRTRRPEDLRAPRHRRCTSQ